MDVHLNLNELMAPWTATSQLVGWVALLLANVLVIKIVISGVIRCIRGYPEDHIAAMAKALEMERARVEMDSLHECEHEDNLTGYCLKDGGCCRTKQECEATVERLDGI